MLQVVGLALHCRFEGNQCLYLMVCPAIVCMLQTSTRTLMSRACHHASGTETCVVCLAPKTISGIGHRSVFGSSFTWFDLYIMSVGSVIFSSSGGQKFLFLSLVVPLYFPQNIQL